MGILSLFQVTAEGCHPENKYREQFTEVNKVPPGLKQFRVADKFVCTYLTSRDGKRTASSLVFLKSNPDEVTCISRLKKYCILLLQVLTRRRKGKYQKAEVITFCLWCVCGEEVDQNPETPKLAVG